MGRGKEEQPRRLAEKLRQIRLHLQLSQQGMADALERQGVNVYRGYIGLYEVERKIPSLLVIRAYAKAGNVLSDEIIDDDLNLPKQFLAK
jgi:transcriptional regulator with XRE-family HTH domain